MNNLFSVRCCTSFGNYYCDRTLFLRIGLRGHSSACLEIFFSEKCKPKIIRMKYGSLTIGFPPKSLLAHSISLFNSSNNMVWHYVLFLIFLFLLTPIAKSFFFLGRKKRRSDFCRCQKPSNASHFELVVCNNLQSHNQMTWKIG